MRHQEPVHPASFERRVEVTKGHKRKLLSKLAVTLEAADENARNYWIDYTE
jgi:hypothetical protein